MTGEKLFESIGGIDDRYIEEAAEENAEQASSLQAENRAQGSAAEAAGGDSAGSENININIDEKSPEKTDGIKSGTDKKARRARLAGIAACFICLICVAGIGAFSVLGNGANENDFTFMKNGSYDHLFADGADQAAIIFSQFGDDRDGGDDTDGSDYKTADSIAECPYEYSRSFDEKRKELEVGNKIPVLEEHKKFSCTAAYMKDDSLYSLALDWQRVSSGEVYEIQSAVSLTAAYHEIEDFNCCVAEMQDENGNVIKPKETVVDGITIESEGGNGLSRSLSFYKDGIWYRVGSEKGSNDDLGKVLDWVWNNGIDLKGAFAAENGDRIEYDSFKAEGVEEYDNLRIVKSSAFYDDIPADFAACLPKFGELGWKPVKCDITLKNGEADIVECTYEYGQDRRTIWTARRVDSSADELEADMYAETELGELSELLIYGAERGGTKTAGYERLEEAVNGEHGLILGFSIGKNDGYCYHHTSLTTGRLTAEQVWQELETVYSNWR